jgi:hypothetical protein
MSGVEGCRIELASADQTCDDGEAGVVVAGVGAASAEGLLHGDAGSLGVSLCQPDQVLAIMRV